MRHEAVLRHIADSLVGWDITRWPAGYRGGAATWIAEVDLDGDVSVELRSSDPEGLIAAGRRIDPQCAGERHG